MKSDAHAPSSGPASAAPGRPLRIVMAGGGTGGHLYPGLAIAEALRESKTAADRRIELIWAATPRSVDQRLLSGFGENYIRQPVRPLTRSIRQLWAFWRGWRRSCHFWAEQFSTHKTDCVVALGGYAAGPASYIAAKRGIPVILLNPDALPGKANRFLLKRADLIITQWPLPEGFTKSLRGEVKVLGCPIRPELTRRLRSQAGAMLSLDPKLRTLVVTGASLGAKNINDAFLVLLGDQTVRQAFQKPPGIPGRAGREGGEGGADWQVVHLAGLDQAEAVRAEYAKWPEVQSRVIGYCDDMASIWALADLAIARAGASTCAELTACGVPSILLPYPYHKDMHQQVNAEALVQARAAVIVKDVKHPQLNALAIKKALHPLLYDDDKRSTMARAARIAGKPLAAEQIAAEILSRIGASSR